MSKNQELIDFLRVYDFQAQNAQSKNNGFVKR